jgi:glycerate-2-kinase
MKEIEKNWIKNLDSLSTTKERSVSLSVVNSAYNAICTSEVIKNKIKLEGDNLSVEGENFDLTKFKRIKVVGFGKSAGDSAKALEEILSSRISVGAVVDISKVECSHIEVFMGTHPRPTRQNIDAGKRIYEIVSNSNEEDLIIVLVSGGGSALLCYPESEYQEGARLYDNFLKSGKTINEINTVRKHLSMLKGGGLAQLAYPATIIGIIFSDVPGDIFENVASGVTYLDKTTLSDAEKIIKDNNLGEFQLIETPKEEKYFEKVKNFVLVSNKIAVEAMEERVKSLGMKTKVFSTDLYDEVSKISSKIFEVAESDLVVLAAGEPSVVVPNPHGKGGRNLHLGLLVLKKYFYSGEENDSVFISFASDGMDNSDAAGAVIDKHTAKKAKELNLDIDDYIKRFDSYNFFEKTGDLIKTGQTGANVSDLMILLCK